MSLQFNRTYQLFAGGFVISGLRCSFDITKSISRIENRATVSVYNVNRDTAARMEAAGDRRERFRLEAGYDGKNTLIFDGPAVVVSVYREGTERRVDFTARDAFRSSRVNINKSIAKGSTIQKAIEQVAKTLGVQYRQAVKEAGSISGALLTLAKDMVLSGKSIDQLDILCERINAEWSIIDGNLKIVGLDRTSGVAPKLSKSTGLLESPRKIKDEKRLFRAMVSAKSLLIPGLNPYNQLEIESDTVNGRFKVEKLSHSGDTRGPNWFTTFQGYEVK